MINIEVVVTVLVAVVIIYAILGLVLSYSWNHSVRVIVPSSGELGVWNALMLLLTVHALTGGLHTTVQHMYEQNVNKV